MFSKEHFIWLGLCTIFIVTMSIVSVKKKFSLKTSGYIMTIICFASEFSKIMVNMKESSGGGMHLDPLSLPFHLCSLMIFVIVYITFGKDGKVKDVLIDLFSIAGTLGSFCALMIPTIGTAFNKIQSYQCFVYHAGLMWFAIYLIATKRARLGKVQTLIRNLCLMLCLTIMTLYVNSALSIYDTNFFYLTRPPLENLPILNLDDGWYAYFFRVVAIALSAITLLHLPFIINEKKKTKK